MDYWFEELPLLRQQQLIKKALASRRETKAAMRAELAEYKRKRHDYLKRNQTNQQQTDIRRSGIRSQSQGGSQNSNSGGRGRGVNTSSQDSNSSGRGRGVKTSSQDSNSGGRGRGVNTSSQDSKSSGRGGRGLS